MENFKALIKDVLENGRYKMDRTGTGCYSLFGRTLRFNLEEGFPLVTLKKTNITPIAKELLWFIAGGTNIYDPQFDGCRFWDEWALKEDVVKLTPYSIDDLIVLAAKRQAVTQSEMNNRYRALVAIEVQARGKEEGLRRARQAMREAAGVDGDYQEKVVARRGDIGPMYGRQWRDFNGVDQLRDVIELLRRDPATRRAVVSAWNPKVLPDPTMSPTDNVAEGRGALAACHTLFQFQAELLTEEERLDLLSSINQSLESMVGGLYDETGDFKDPGSREHMRVLGLLAKYDIPCYRLSCMLTQRSCDTLIGWSFNVASYALLTHLVANELNMLPGDFIHSMGDVHIYADQLTHARECLKRPTHCLPTLKIHRPVGTSIFDIRLEDIEVVDYVSEPFMKIPVSV